MAILECRLVFFSYEYDGGGFGSEERSQAGLLEVIDVLIFARRQILEGRLITHVCIKGNYKFFGSPSLLFILLFTVALRNLKTSSVLYDSSYDPKCSANSG